MAYVSLQQARANVGLGSSSSGGSSGGYVPLDQARSQLLSANSAKPKVTQPAQQTNQIRQIQTPAKGFQIGDIIPSIESGIGNIAKTAENLVVHYNLNNVFSQSVQQIGDIVKNPLSLGQKVDKGTINTVKNLVSPSSPQQVSTLASDMWNVVKPSITQEKKAWDQFTQTLTQPSVSKKVGTAAHVIAGAGNVAFSPVTAFFNAANKISVIGTVSKLVTLPFTVAGEGATGLSNGIIDQLPIPKSVKENLKPGIGEIAALAAQLVLGKVSDIGASKRGELIDKYGVQDAMTIEAKAKEIAKSQGTKLNPGENTPQQIIDHVISNKLENTPDGKMLMKNAVDAQKQGVNVEVQPPKDQQLMQQYRTQFPNKMLNTDNVRELYQPEGYNRINSADFQDKASKVSDQLFTEDISHLTPNDNYLFTAGVSGAGKSTGIALNPDLLKNAASGLDGNFSSPEALSKLKRVIDTGAKPTILFTYRDPIDAWNNGVVRRALNPKDGRVVPMDVFLKNLENSQKYTLKAKELYGDKVDLQIVDNSHGQGNAKAVPYDQTVDFLKNIKYNVEDVKNSILESTKEQIQNGTLSSETGNALLGKFGRESGSEPKPQRENAESPQNSRVNGVNSRGEPENATTSTAKPEGKPSRIGKSIEAKAIEANLTKGFKDTAGYTPITIKAQAKMATDLVNNDLGAARAIVRGESALPEGLKGVSLITAMEEHIKQNPSADVAYELANSPLITGTSEAAQELRLAAERTPDSATAKLAEIKKAREDAITKSGKTLKQATTATIKDIQKEIAKTNPKKLDWAGFVKSISC